MYACNKGSGNCAWKKNISSFLDSNNLVNKRSKLVAKYRHESKYLFRS